MMIRMPLLRILILNVANKLTLNSSCARSAQFSLAEYAANCTSYQIVRGLFPIYTISTILGIENLSPPNLSTIAAQAVFLSWTAEKRYLTF